MPAGPPITDYTGRDYGSLLASLLDLAARKLPEWTDRSSNDTGRMLLEAFAYVGDVQLFAIDRLANEAFLSTAVERRSVIDLLGLIGYSLGTPAAAATDLTVTVADDAATPVRVEPGARFASKASPGRPAIEFVFLPTDGLARELPRTGGGGTISFPQPLAVPLTVLNATPVARESVGTSTGDPNQAFALAQRPVILPRDPDAQDNLRVEVDEGGGFTTWVRRATMLYSRSGDRHFVVGVDDADRATIYFGDGTYGRLPPAGSPVRVSYLVGGGSAGNVAAGTVTVVKSGVSVTATVTNPQAASGGEDRETIEHARRLAPRVYRSLQRAVTATDYAALAESVPGVARAVAVAPAWNYVDLYVIAAGGLDLTADLRAKLIRFFDPRRMVTTQLTVRSPVFVRVELTVAVGVEEASYRDDVRRRAEEAVAALFALDRLDFGQPVYLSKVYEAVEQVPGVAFAEVARFRGFRSAPAGEAVDPAEVANVLRLRDREFARLGPLVVTATGGLQ